MLIAASQEARSRRLSCWSVRALGVLAVLVALTACASLRAAERAAEGVPITGIDLIAGKWAGTRTPGSPGMDDRFYLTITPDFKMTASWGVNTTWGTVTLRDGQAAYQMDPGQLEGTIRLYVKGTRRTLVLDDLWATYSAELTPES